jgi:CheY-like chemotaxis protein
MSEPSARRRVLVVEDEPANRALLRATVSRAPALAAVELIEVATLGEAREVLARGPVDLILLDVRLPDGSGIDLAEELVAAGPTRPPIVILSASVLPAERDQAIRTGAEAFLGKPYRPGELMSLIERLLDR